ncbi:N-acyl homoserine lactonase family protein [Yinghuangia sp. ASG 101]|uniref:N-acyl homoserine lactonase family protein n=1 Tax=Yinghuangia sp. ASG 101 TaxID=2896848 RepID=UPI001E3E8720|nr:N-acyl homoserine lactonase family protein [Yinghuangia sp. ASG 101]UGQ13374.1 N-acyl homoserine lactonase family protein [Yinghuangia sp. ASG 101]
MAEPTVHEIYAVKFGQNDTAERGHFFMGAAAEPCCAQVGLDYFVWAIRSPGQDIVLDAGFTAATNVRRRRNHFENPTAALARIGVDAATVPYVVLSHMHYDHVGDLAPFGSAKFVLQSDEMAFWTGPFASRGEFARLIEPDDVLALVRLGLEGRIRWVDGTREIVDGVWVMRVGGHTPGTQATLVRTALGIVVLAADASHFYENIDDDKPFAVHHDVPGLYRAFDEMREAATSGLVVPGHDPALFDRFEAVPGHEGRVLRIA